MAKEKRDKLRGNEIIYGVDDSPPWYSCIIFGFQHYLTLIGSTIAVPLFLSPAMCVEDDIVGKSELICTNIFVCGVTTLLQSTLGTRLPIMQGPSAAFYPPFFAIMALPKWKCPDIPEMFLNATTNEAVLNTAYMDWRRNEWTSRIREIQGAIALAAVFQVLVGLTGIMGFLLRFIGPLTVASTMCLIGISLYQLAARSSSKQWGIAALTVFLIIVFSQYLRNIEVPLPNYTRGKGWSKKRFPVFKAFPVISSVIIVWGLCAILTTSGVFPDDKKAPNYEARTDTKLFVLDEAKWFKFPYPGQWGLPTFSAAAVLGMLSGVIAGIMESVGDYYACARISNAPALPPHAVNRGILIEGIAIIIAGMCGTGTGVTSYSSNIGVIGITKVASRRVLQAAAVILVIFGMIGKIGALFVTIPEPIIGGLFLCVFGMVFAVGVSNLQFTDMNSSRNLFVFGFSVFVGFTLSTWMKEGTNANIISTGSTSADQILTVLLSTPMFVGGFMGFLLDNTIPGTLEERGILKWLSNDEVFSHERAEDVYGFPCGMSCLKASGWSKYLPFLPTYDPSCLKHRSSGTAELAEEQNHQPNVLHQTYI